MIERGYKVDSLHGDKNQDARERTMQAFRNRRVTILVCTDVASRGIDVKDITHVINYSLPRELENYVHRIGRTARSGKTGIAMNLVTHSHRRLIYAIENHTKSKMLEGRIPSRREIGARKVAKELQGFQSQEADVHSRAIEVMSDEWKALLATMSAEEVAARFLTMMMPDVFRDRPANERVQKIAMQEEAEMPRPRPQRERTERPQSRPENRQESRPLPPYQKAFLEGRTPKRRPDRVERPRHEHAKTSAASARELMARARTAAMAKGEALPLNRRERRALKFAQAAAGAEAQQQVQKS